MQQGYSIVLCEDAGNGRLVAGAAIAVVVGDKAYADAAMREMCIFHPDAMLGVYGPCNVNAPYCRSNGIRVFDMANDSVFVPSPTETDANEAAFDAYIEAQELAFAEFADDVEDDSF